MGQRRAQDLDQRFTMAGGQLKLLIFSDIHDDLKSLEKVLAIEADYYFAAGDLVNWGRGLEKVGPLLARHSERMFVLPGNHESASNVEDLCRDFGLHNFHGGTLELAGYHVAGLGYSNPTPFNTPGEYSEAELAKRLLPFAGLHPLILICHCPPKNTPLDRAGPGQHFGSTAVKDFIDTEQPVYFFCGHIHEAAGVETLLGKTRGWNVGKKGHLLEI